MKATNFGELNVGDVFLAPNLDEKAIFQKTGLSSFYSNFIGEKDPLEFCPTFNCRDNRTQELWQLDDNNEVLFLNGA